jgi:tetratricopeptide (TPR) repeat protein
LLADALYGSQDAELWRWCESTVAAFGTDPPPALAAPLFAVMGLISARFGYGRERRTALLDRGLELARAAGDARTLAQILMTVAFNLTILQRLEESLDAAREGLEYARTSGDRRLLALGLMREGMAVFANDVAQGRKLFDEAIALFTAADDPAGSCTTLLNRAEWEFEAGDVQAALRFAQAAIPMARKMKRRSYLVTLLGNAAAYQVVLGDFDEALTCARESITLAREAQAWQAVAFGVQHLAAVAFRKGDPRTAARLIGWVDARIKAIDEGRQTTEKQEYNSLIAGLQNALSSEQFGAFTSEGALLNEDAACEEALRV